MQMSSQEGEIPVSIPIPINSSYGGGHGHGQMNIHQNPAPPNDIIPTSALSNQIPSNVPMPKNLEDNVPYKKMVRYRECLKNHAASMGANATDGCGEFMPNGMEGTLEALTCSACSCHRNFHRKEIEGELPYNNSSSCECHFVTPFHLKNMVNGRKLILGQHKGMLELGPETLGYSTGTLVPSRVPSHHQMMMSYNVEESMPSDQSDEQEGVGGYGDVGVVGTPLPPPPQLVKKRFRTRFTQEQKERMLNFAERVGWKIQKQEENVVQNFCQEIGIKRRVLKVWMHNNKHNLAKKNSSTD